MSSKTGMNDSVDYLAMLLSTDWFYSFWPIIGVQVHEGSKKHVQTQCRILVKKFTAVSGECFDYFQCDLSETRKLATRVEFIRVLHSVELDVYAIASVLRGLVRKSYSPERLKLVEDITALLDENYFDDIELQLEARLKASLLRTWKTRKELYDEWGNLDVDFAEHNLSSNSVWDQFARSLTPNIPTCLSDLLSNSRIVVPEIEYVWCATAERLSHQEILSLLEWYRRMGRSVSNQNLTLQTLSLSNELTSMQEVQTEFAPSDKRLQDN